jgi:hypothetical protein
MNTVEYERLIGRKPVDAFHEFNRYIGIMQCRPDVMNGMVTVVPAGVIVFCIDTIDRVVLRVLHVNESVLRPVTNHHHEAGEYKGNDKDQQRGLEIDKAHGNAKNEK